MIQEQSKYITYPIACCILVVMVYMLFVGKPSNSFIEKSKSKSQINNSEIQSFQTQHMGSANPSVLSTIDHASKSKYTAAQAVDPSQYTDTDRQIINYFNLDNEPASIRDSMLKFMSKIRLTDAELESLFSWYVEFFFIRENNEVRHEHSLNIPDDWIRTNAYGATLEDWKALSDIGDPIASRFIANFLESGFRYEQALDHAKKLLVNITDEQTAYSTIIRIYMNIGEEKKAAAFLYHMEEDLIGITPGHLFSEIRTKYSKQDVTDNIAQVSREIEEYEALYGRNQKIKITDYMY